MTTYTGGCHCGKVRYEVSADIGKVYACNCSICSKKGWLLTFVPADQFKLTSGSDDLTDYQFHTHNVHHLFCRHCGIQSFSHGKRKDGTAVYSINMRCLDDVDLSKFEVTHVDGKKL